MAKVEYNADDMEIFGILEVNTYFIYQDQFFVRVSEYETKNNVFNFNENSIFRWDDKYDNNAMVKIISPDRITIQID